jgi:CheY-like chemotaxis protein
MQSTPESPQELRARIAELEERLRASERAGEAKARFAAIVSHELRTPMNGILATVELLARCELPPAARELVSLLERAGKELLAIVGDVLDFSRAESGRLEVEAVPFDLHDALMAVADLQRHAAARKGIGFDCVIADGVPRHVVGDPVRLRQVLLNLVDNAIKFTASGSVRVDVRPASPQRLAFRVIDTGLGIESAALASIFEPFVQAERSTARRYGGSGLGLAICRQIVTRMGGEIRVDSEPGVGSTFSFEIELPAASGLQTAQDAVRPAGLPNAAGMRVLVVDDNAVNRLVAARMVEHLGGVATMAEDGRQAVALAMAQPFDVVLMDCSMQGMDGFEAAAAIRSSGSPFAAVPIVATTGNGSPADVARCLAAGMNGHLGKPLQFARLERLLSELAGNRR